MINPKFFRVTLLLALLSSLVCLPGPAGPGTLWAQTGMVGGTVVDRATLEPLPGAQIMVEGTEQGALTNEAGRFLIRGVSGGQVSLQIILMGYATEAITVQVGTTDLRIMLGQTAVELDELVVTGTAGDTRKRVLGNAVSQINAAAATELPIENVTELLNGRATGVVVSQGSGVAGTTSEIRIRGRSSLREVSDAPLIYVDGIRVNNAITGGFGDPATSRLDDIDPAIIESIEIIKGPAAATLYGTEASNGVIQIITKRGASGPARWDLTVRQGMSYFNDAAGRLEENYWTNPSGQVLSENLVELEEQRGTPIFSTGHDQFYNLSVTGGTDVLQYFISGSGTLNQGVTPDNSGSRYNGRMNLSAAPTPTIHLRMNSDLIVSRYRLPMMGNDGVLPSLQRGSPSTLNEPRRGWQTAPPETLYRAFHYNQDVNRFTGGFTLEHDPAEWFNHRLTAGLDFTDQQSAYYTPRLGEQDAQFFSPEFASGSKNVNRQEVLYSTLEYTATASFPVTDNFATNTSGGFQLYKKSVEVMQAEGQGFPATGVKSIAGAGTYQRGRDNFVDNNTVGFFLQEQVGWKDRLFLTAAIRADDNSAFGENFDLVYYPKVSASWVITEEPFWNLDWVNSLRFRGAYGESGQQPDAFAALRTFEARPDPRGVAAVTPQSAGNPDLGPERGKEIEVGFDLTLLDGRVDMDLTYYNQKTTDAILSRNVAPSTGFAGTQFVNIGEIANSGFEVGINATALDTRDVDWDVGVSFNTNNNEITKLGLDGWLDIGWTTRHQEGYPVGSFFAAKVLSAELDADGTAINAMCADGEGGAISCEDAPWVYLGHPTPDYEGSFSSTVTLLDRFRIRGLLDFQHGQSKYLTDRWNRCAWRENCEINAYPERFDPRAVVAAQNGGWNEFDWWIQDASFARLREVSVDYTLPESWLAKIGARAGRISLGGRNLATFTDYPGLDPETMDITNSVTEPIDQSILPPLRQFSFTVNLGY
jgi:TonB-linked SusC/RagA family outer membrane protein